MNMLQTKQRTLYRGSMTETKGRKHASARSMGRQHVVADVVVVVAVYVEMSVFVHDGGNECMQVCWGRGRAG